MTGHGVLGYALFVIWLIITVYVGITGWDYYQLPFADRPLDANHKVLKPGGFWGHGLGVVGSFLMIFGVVMYMARKRFRWMMNWGNLRVWLTVHIFLCVMGATLVTFHTAFKVGGLVAVSFWCMVGVVLSGILGRYVYVRIPRDIRGRSVNAEKLRADYEKVCQVIQQKLSTNHAAVVLLTDMMPTQRVSLMALLKGDLSRFFQLRDVRRALKADGRLSAKQVQPVIRLAKKQAALHRSIHFYQTLQNVLHYWHVVHLPFTVVMFLVMIIHVMVAILFGHRWIF